MRCSGMVWAVHRGRVVPGIRRPRRQALALDPAVLAPGLAALVVRVRRVAVALAARAPVVSAVVAVPAVSVRAAVPAAAVA